MSCLALLVTQSMLAALSGLPSTPSDPPVTSAAVADAAPPNYPPPPFPYPPPPPVYGPPPIYLQPFYGSPPGYPRVRAAVGPAASPPPVAAVATPLRSLPYTHDGFHFRMTVGGGVTSATHHDNSGNNVSILGADADITVAAGWTVVPNLELLGALFVSGMEGPNVNGVAMNMAGLSGGFGGFGAGLTYGKWRSPRIEPQNLESSRFISSGHSASAASGASGDGIASPSPGKRTS